MISSAVKQRRLKPTRKLRKLLRRNRRKTTGDVEPRVEEKAPAADDDLFGESEAKGNAAPKVDDKAPPAPAETPASDDSLFDDPAPKAEEKKPADPKADDDLFGESEPK